MSEERVAVFLELDRLIGSLAEKADPEDRSTYEALEGVMLRVQKLLYPESLG